MTKKNIFLVLAIIIIALVIYLPSYTRLQNLRDKNQELRDKITALEEKNARLAEEKQLLDEDPVYLEKVARDKMGIAREGEVIFKMTPSDSQ